MRAVAAAALVLASLAPAAQAGEPEPKPPPQPKRPSRALSLQEVIALALEHNLLLAAEKINPRLAHTIVVEQEAIFDPTTYGELSRAKTKEQSPLGLFGNRQQSAAATLGVAKLLAPGTLVDIHVAGARERNNAPFYTVNPPYSERWGLSISQPHLRGFGVRVNTAGIATAHNERRIAQAQLRQVAIATVADATRTYWQLVFAIRDRALLQRSLDRALGLQREIGIRVDAGDLAARPSVAQAAAEVAVRHEDTVEADQAIHDAEDLLKVITDLKLIPDLPDGTSAWDFAVDPLTEPPRDVPPLDADAAIETALAKRPDYQQARLGIGNRDIVLYVRRNELKPKLDLALGYGNTGLNTSWNAAEHDLGSLDYYQWTIGLTFEYPLGNRAARARFRRARLERDQARIGLQALERQIQLELRSAIRAVATNVERRRAAQASVEAEQVRLSAETDKFKQKEVTTQDLLDAQAALAEAERRALRSLIDLNNALVDLERLKATILETHNVTWEDD